MNRTEVNNNGQHEMDEMDCASVVLRLIHNIQKIIMTVAITYR
jgi:hypothetical protein